MPDIFVMPITYAPGTNGKCKISGQAIESSEHYVIGFDAEVNYDDNATQINAALIDAAIAEFARLEPPFTIGVGDTKRLFGGAV